MKSLNRSNSKSSFKKSPSKLSLREGLVQRLSSKRKERTLIDARNNSNVKSKEFILSEELIEQNVNSRNYKGIQFNTNRLKAPTVLSNYTKRVNGRPEGFKDNNSTTNKGHIDTLKQFHQV